MGHCRASLHRRLPRAALAVAALLAWGAPPGRAEIGTPYGNIAGAYVPEASGLEDFWIRADYLYWQLSGSDLPPLVTSSPANTDDDVAGVLGDSSTTVLSGGQRELNGWRSGWLVSGGYWLDPANGWAISGEYFDAGRDSYSFNVGPRTGKFIARPYKNAETNLDDAEIIDQPNALAGSVSVSAHADFHSAGASIMGCLRAEEDSLAGYSSKLSFIGGYRFYHHDSALTISDVKTDISSGMSTTTGDVNRQIDSFGARNEFHGIEFGLLGRIQRREFWLEGLAALAIGGNSRLVTISGSEIQFDASAPADEARMASLGGLLTSPLTNIGQHSSTRGVVIPRFRIETGCQVTERLSVHLGYNLIIWSDVAQAAEHLPAELLTDGRNLPFSQTRGGPDPAFPGFQGDTVVAHGMNLGLQLDF